VFLDIGLTTFELREGYSGVLVLVTIAACVLGRAAHIYSISCCLNGAARRRHKRREARRLLMQGEEAGVAAAAGKPTPSADAGTGSAAAAGAGAGAGAGGGGGGGGSSRAATALPDAALPVPKAQQHMLVFAGLRGAIAYALASAFPGAYRDYFRSTTMILVMLSVVLLGGSTRYMLGRLRIRVGVGAPAPPSSSAAAAAAAAAAEPKVRASQMVKSWLAFDANFIIPFLTRSAQEGAGAEVKAPLVTHDGHAGVQGDEIEMTEVHVA